MIDSLRSSKESGSRSAAGVLSFSASRVDKDQSKREPRFDAPPAIKEAETLRRLENESGRVIRISFQSVCKERLRQIFRRGKAGRSTQAILGLSNELIRGSVDGDVIGRRKACAHLRNRRSGALSPGDDGPWWRRDQRSANQSISV